MVDQSPGLPVGFPSRSHSPNSVSAFRTIQNPSQPVGSTDNVIDGVVSLLRRVDEDPDVLRMFENTAHSLISLLESDPSDERSATCLTAVALLTGHPEQAVRWARWLVCIKEASKPKDFESHLFLALAQWCCGESTQAAHTFMRLTGTDVDIDQARFGLAMAYAVIGDPESLNCYEKEIAQANLPLSQLLQILRRPMCEPGERVEVGKGWAREWCTGRLLWFLRTSIFVPLVSPPVDECGAATTEKG